MAVQVECPKCKRRNGLKSKACTKCGFNLIKKSGKIYWIDVRINGKRMRERIGPSKLAAETRHNKLLTARAEEKVLEIDKDAKVTLGEICRWYLDLKEAKAKKSYDRYKQFISVILRLLDEKTLIKNLSIGMVKEFRITRLEEPSPIYPGKTISKSTVNNEVSCLVTVLNTGIEHKKIRINPIAGIKKLKHNNKRDRTLTDDEFHTLLQSCPEYMKGIILISYDLGMRQKEILTLTWDKVDLKEGFIRLDAEDTKTNTKRSIPIISYRVLNMLKEQPRGLHTNRVFLKNGKPMKSFNGCTRRDFTKALKQAKIEEFRFHDLRHCAITNFWKRGVDPLLIMAIVGHSSLDMNLRYTNPTEDDLKKLAKTEMQEGVRGHLYGHQSSESTEKNGGVDETRTRGLRRDRPAL
jgi:integrase